MLWCSENSVFTFGREQKDRSSFEPFQNFYYLFRFLLSPDLKSQKPLSTPLNKKREEFPELRRSSSVGAIIFTRFFETLFCLFKDSNSIFFNLMIFQYKNLHQIGFWSLLHFVYVTCALKCRYFTKITELRRINLCFLFIKIEIKIYYFFKEKIYGTICLRASRTLQMRI